MTAKATQLGSGPAEAWTKAKQQHPWAQAPAELPGILGLCKSPAQRPLGLSFSFNPNRKWLGPCWFCPQSLYDSLSQKESRK